MSTWQNRVFLGNRRAIESVHPNGRKNERHLKAVEWGWRRMLQRFSRDRSPIWGHIAVHVALEQPETRAILVPPRSASGPPETELGSGAISQHHTTSLLDLLRPRHSIIHMTIKSLSVLEWQDYREITDIWIGSNMMRAQEADEQSDPFNNSMLPLENNSGSCNLRKRIFSKAFPDGDLWNNRLALCTD